MLTSDRGKILLLVEGGSDDLKEALSRSGGEMLCSGGADVVMRRFLEAAGGSLAPYQRWELWDLPPEGPHALGPGEGGRGEKKPEAPVHEASFRVPAHTRAFASLGLVVVSPRERESSLSLSPLDRGILAELARQGGSARMRVLCLKLEKAANTLKNRLKYLERLGYVRRDGERSSALYVLLRGAE